MSNASNESQQPKRGTCYAWARGECEHPHSPSKCGDAHHLFPVISERVSPIVDKLMQSKKSPGVQDDASTCQWPSDACCWSHVVVDKKENSKQKLVQELVKKRPWQAVLRYKCTVPDCEEPEQEYQSIEEVLKHTRVKHGQPLGDSGSWKGEREPIQEGD